MERHKGPKHALPDSLADVEGAEHKTAMGWFNRAYDARINGNIKAAISFEELAMDSYTPNELLEYLTNLIRHYAFENQTAEIDRLLAHPILKNSSMQAEATMAVIEGLYLGGEIEKARSLFDKVQHQISEGHGMRATSKKMRALGRFVADRSSR